jgi:predicted ATP-dependent serine protease
MEHPVMTVSAAIQKVLAEHPQASNAQVALAVQGLVPGATTTAASVASIKSRMRATSNVVPLAVAGMMATTPAAPVAPDETDEEIDARIARRYAAFERMAKRVAAGTCRSLIVSGAPGLGKSHTIMEALAEADTDHEVIRGSISAVGL